MGKKVRKGRCKKNNLQAAAEEPEEVVKAPHSFIFHRGVVGKHIKILVRDLRNVMEPYTATNLRARKNNNIKDFVSVSGMLHVSHMFIFTQTTISPYMRIVRLPKGPTMTFKIHNYALSNDVLSSHKKQYAFNNIFLSAPLAVINGFVGDSPHIKLMLTTFQGMFPTLNVTTVNLKTITRCVLFNYNAETKTIDFRHYVISSAPLGISKAVKKLGKNKIPDLSRFSDMSEFITKAEVLSDSEFEDDPNSHVSLPQTIGRRSLKGNKASVRLTEYGPRLTLQLIKVEEGVMEGEVMFHEYVQKTEEEKEEIKRRMAAQKKLKEKRRREQAQNVKKKAEEKEMLKQKSLAGMKKAGVLGEQKEQAEEDDDAEWFRKEVGQEPEPELFQKNEHKKSILKRKSNYESDLPKKKVKLSGNSKRISWSNDVKPPNNDFKKGKGKAKKVISSKAKPRKKNLGTRVKKGKRH